MADSCSTELQPAASPVPDARLRVPEHVVYRSFPSETVLLNLTSGIYHGLNATAGRMLEALEQADSFAAAVAIVAQEFGQPPELVEQDMRGLCKALFERGLLVQDDGATHGGP
jgi:hypothetical protein